MGMKTSFVILVGVTAWVGFAALLTLQLTGWRGFCLPVYAEVVLWINFLSLSLVIGWTVFRWLRLLRRRDDRRK
jgi:hypothetical protein